MNIPMDGSMVEGRCDPKFAEVREAFEASWRRNEAAYRYLAEH